ncbi:GtrA family protein [Rudaeicoccus suwonensis]|uniref:Putative flippase GtrA n=1 Tax=Rudaeicoccus suwonensis TaxID=657409 RepID=A0A561E914_9MICO|nr:GtrA family protein [Rudaeicoccus suwonensis]TWE12091.1 putative flippase GtrA [Rudaeicoccus suwonensis]
MLWGRITDLITRLWRELAKFGVVGALSMVIDLGGFNWLVDGPMAGKITTAKFISGTVAMAFAWVGNRYWTFRHRRNRPVHHEAALFFIVGGIALVISTAWVAFAHYGLHMHGKFWLNFNAFFGIGLGTLFRFWSYKKFVFANEPVQDEAAAEALLDPLEHGHTTARDHRLGNPESTASPSDRNSANTAG